LRELEARPGREEDAWAFGGFAPSFGRSGRGSLAEVIAQTGAEESFPIPAIEADSRRQGLGELPEAGLEVRSIAAAFEQQHRAGTAYLGGQATEASFKQRASEYAYLHVASHSYIDERHPGLTGILFGNRDTSGEDGVLHAGEMFDLELQASLVVLSSCESGLGKMVPGEGLLAMTRGLFWSGAQNVMVSLWDVYDTHARDLMVRFYPHLLRGESIASSIREAKLAMIADRRTAFPGKWGGFVHLGGD